MCSPICCTCLLSCARESVGHGSQTCVMGHMGHESQKTTQCQLWFLLAILHVVKSVTVVVKESRMLYRLIPVTRHTLIAVIDERPAQRKAAVVDCGVRLEDREEG